MIARTTTTVKKTKFEELTASTMTATTTKQFDLTATTRRTTTKHKSITVSLWAHSVVLVVLAGAVAAAAEGQQALRFFCHRMKCKGLASYPHKEADLSLVFQPEQPVFCHNWHFCEDFGSCGGRLQGKQSDVVLALPEGAVKGMQKVSGAVCTDLDKVHKVLGLAPNEHIVSPVVEYCSEPQVRFHRPVQVILPHFLPLSWAEPAMTVYSVQQDARGEVAVAKLKLWHQGSSPDARPQGGQYYIHNDSVHIFTDHFTAFFCSVCSEECPPQPLLLDVWAKHCRDVDLVWEQEQGIGSLVEIRLYIWIGGQYMIKDFRACASFPACGERTIATDGCFQVDQSSIRCSHRCPDGYYPSQTVCDSTSGLTTAGSAVTVTAAFSVCSEVCYSCSAAGASSCCACAEGYVFTADSSTSGRCTARVAKAAAIDGSAAALLAVMLISVPVSLLLCLWCRRKFLYRSERTNADWSRESPGSRDISSVQYNSYRPARPSPISPDFTDDIEADGTESTSSVTFPSVFNRSSRRSCVLRCVEDQISCRQITVLNCSWTTSSTNSGFFVFSTSLCETEHSEYSLGYSKYSENENMSPMNTFRSYESCTSTQTDFSDKEDDDRPYFSDAWQIREEFTSQGGTLQSPLSDVRVEIPAAAIQEDMYILLKGAICTDLDFVHRNFQLPDNEYIMSPVAEYSAAVQRGFQFQKPVRVVLPHFLPPSFSKGNVKVYQCRMSESGDCTIETLPLEDKDNLLRRPWNQNGFPQPTGVFSLAANSEIHIWTSHFSVYFCTDCGTEYPPPELRVEVHAKHVVMDADQRQVDVRLEIWDSRLQIQDFRNQHYGRTSENFRGMLWIDSKSLSALAESNLPLYQVKTSLELKANCARSWMHTTRGNDTLYPVESILNLRDFIPCTCHQARIPQRVDWQLVGRPGKTPGDVCGCYVDVGYVSGDGSYVTEPRKVTIDVNVRKCLEEDLNKVGDASRLPSGPNNQRRRVYNNLDADDFSSETKPKQRLEQTASDDSDEYVAAGGGRTPSLERHFSGVSIGSCGKVCVYNPPAGSNTNNVAQTGSRVGRTAEPHQQRRTCPGTSGSSPMTQAETDTGSSRLSLPVASPVARHESRQTNAGRSSPVPRFLEQAETQGTSAAAETSVGSLAAENTTGPSRPRECALPAPIPATEQPVDEESELETLV